MIVFIVRKLMELNLLGLLLVHAYFIAAAKQAVLVY